ncbi:hypothetical protein [Paraburkholderia unamae]|uniref:hypothetical protein n=1 Tax=Paraburkholderia unamae TaxID=219649 RepID=UPI0010577514|nr:hypothetical protein [Paraburkholderia unamae]
MQKTMRGCQQKIDPEKVMQLAGAAKLEEISGRMGWQVRSLFKLAPGSFRWGFRPQDRDAGWPNSSTLGLTEASGCAASMARSCNAWVLS